MIIILTGGGSGGHITPILAVASALKKLRPEVHIVYIGQKGDGLSDIPMKHPAIDKVYTIPAGKFRRYHDAGWRQLFDVTTQAKNLRDVGRTLRGLWQSYWLLHRLQPQVIFTRGGFVSVPVALAGALNHVPYITHDSDSTPSLANRLIAHWAVLHAVALPARLYPYSLAKTKMVGIPVSSEYVPVTPKLQDTYRRELELDSYKRILFVTGGGNGSDKLNKVVAASTVSLLSHFSDLAIIHLAGRALEVSLAQDYDRLLDASTRQRVIVKGFVDDMYRYSGAADAIVARGGATAIAEFAVQKKACIIIPAPQLIWQVHHTEALAAQDAVIVLTEHNAEEAGWLTDVITNLLKDTKKRGELSNNLAKFAHTDTAEQVAMLLLDQAM
jgi:UDP-N-acetylglucosamine--N-acetylmuramyl-(pentapeptide) pyrophosphoryl-undecaprenol N-acetylglucosamine transferase